MVVLIENLLFVGKGLIGLLVLEFDHGQDFTGLLTAHHRDLGAGEHVQEAGRVGTATHSVVTGSVRGTKNGGDLGDSSVRNGRHHFGAMLGNTLLLDSLSNHEARDVLQEENRDLSLGAQLNKVSSLLGTFREKHTIIGNDTNWITI